MLNQNKPKGINMDINYRRGYTDNEVKLMEQWLKNNKPKKVGLDMDINEYSKTLTQKRKDIPNNSIF